MLSLDRLRRPLKQLGPGLITGAADDDPSGIATYSQAGAQFGYGMLWSVVFTLPLMAAIQIVSARIGYVTGRGLAANMKQAFPRPLLLMLVGLLLAANTLNIAADIAAMSSAVHLLVGGPTLAYAIAFGVASVLMQVFLAYESYVRWLKWLTLALLAYVGVVLVIDLDWSQVLLRTVHPQLHWNRETVLMVVALFGTTISPYLFFWQAGQEVEDGAGRPCEAKDVRRHLRRIKLDTHVGMGFSNLIAFCIMLSTAATLHAHGVHDIQTSAQAIEALKPVAGEHAALLFSLGIIGTGLLAVPVLAGSAAYAVAEVAGWKDSLSLRLERGEGRGFYAVIAAATLGGVALCFAPLDPVRALFWAAVFNGISAVPIMAAMMVLATRKSIMGEHVIGPKLRRMGWIATVVMALMALALLPF
ncbi:NRAMP (natural resistance-associated macrophage protein)-like metal ion transporter [Pelomonas saccharophila]|uniref:NRAMP (Natural resistance-associated macrophage protein)-like metal ion transporter n=1 Tax=Roseateles saccharophilus TaxID=304 RepID=A0ABU1YP92_ROSSA|nr:divalent metal cation transporter [Roseateles saccharophilus]MDR7270020.1 NRAMP (natural resistance-associated macrophage protein)-like metal ion transporter [Roseateles saccharophilus]